MKETKSDTEQPMIHYNIAPDTIEKMLEARKQLEEAILKYEPVIERLEESWETKVKLLSFECSLGNIYISTVSP